MKLETLEYRVDELEYERLQISKKIKELEMRKERISGKLEEIWDMIDGYKEGEGYGRTTLEGGVRVLKLPVIGSEKGIHDALKGELRAGGGEDEKTARAYRKKKQRDDCQMAVNVMDGMSPDKKGGEDDWKLGRA